MKKILVILFLLVAIGGGVWFGNSIKESQTISQQVKGVIRVPTATPTPTPIPLGKPATLQIPKLAVNTPVEYVGNDAKGNMDVPKNDMHVAWYQPGFLPGAKGNAVLAGHFDTKAGGPAVFYKLTSLQVGDEVIVTDENARMLTFTVVDKQSYPVDNFPVTSVFGDADKPYLNLITCGGVWDAKRKIYADRMVVKAELKQ